MGAGWRWTKRGKIGTPIIVLTIKIKENLGWEKEICASSIALCTHVYMFKSCVFLQEL